MRCFLLVSLSLGITPSLAGQSAKLLKELETEARKEGSFAWSPTRPPAWRDFRGRPRLGSSTAAQTSSGVTYRIQCRNAQSSYAVLATFSTAESWVRPDIPTNPDASRKTLRHERTHFNITELFARRLRRALSRATGVCPHDLKKAHRFFDQLGKTSAKEQRQYDKDSAHGMAPVGQARWDRLVGAQLDSLAGFASPADSP